MGVCAVAIFDSISILSYMHRFVKGVSLDCCDFPLYTGGIWIDEHLDCTPGLIVHRDGLDWEWLDLYTGVLVHREVLDLRSACL